MQEPRRIAKKSVIIIHGRQLAEHGGSNGLRDEGLLESALARPQQLFAYGDSAATDMAAIAAAYAFGIARNHPFIDGNKRTALVTMRTFLAKNACSLLAGPVEKYEAIIRLAAGEWDEDTLASWIRSKLV